jgi:hypothetical protein
MKARRRFKRWLVFGLALAALGSTAAQAATRPDDRAGPLGVGMAAVQSSAVRPDDRAGPLGIGAQPVAADTSDVVSRYAANHPAAVRPDDRAGPLGIGIQPLAADTSDIVSRYLVNHPAAVRPDDRAGPLGIGTDSAGIVTPASDQGESFWGATELGAASALGALAVALAGFALIRHRRSVTAALQS